MPRDDFTIMIRNMLGFVQLHLRQTNALLDEIEAADVFDPDKLFTLFDTFVLVNRMVDTSLSKAGITIPPKNNYTDQELRNRRIIK